MFKSGILCHLCCSIVLDKFSDIIRNVVEALNDVTKLDESGALME